MKRWTIRIGVLLILGAIVNVGVAWGCLHCSRPALQQVSGISGEQSAWLTAIDPRFDRPLIMHQSFGSNLSCDSFLVFVVPSGEIDEMAYSANRATVGLPARSLEYSACISSETGRLVHFGDRQRSILLQALWPGFAINTLFYAVILWLLFAAPFALRRWRRIKRGRCVRCGYDLRGNAGGAKCPECGATLSTA